MAGPNRDLDALFAEGLFESSEALYRALVEQVPAVVYIDSDEQRPDSLYLSPQAEQLFGYPLGQARAAGGPFECEYRIRHRDGRWIPGVAFWAAAATWTVTAVGMVLAERPGGR